MLGSDRNCMGTLQQLGDSQRLLNDERVYAQRQDLAGRIGVDLVPDDHWGMQG